MNKPPASGLLSVVLFSQFDLILVSRSIDSPGPSSLGGVGFCKCCLAFPLLVVMVVKVAFFKWGKQVETLEK